MKALSLWQPHASLVVLPNPATGLPFKKYETRDRRPNYAEIQRSGLSKEESRKGWQEPVSMIGRRIAIHAAKNQTDLVLFNEDDEFRDAVRSLGFKTAESLPLGAIVGTAVLVACHRTERMLVSDVFGDFGPFRWAWEMADARPLAEPIPLRGQQGFFDVPEELFPLLA